MGIYIILSILIIILIVTGVFLIRYYRENQQLRSKYDSIINVDAEVALRQKESA